MVQGNICSVEIVHQILNFDFFPELVTGDMMLSDDIG